MAIINALNANLADCTGLPLAGLATTGTPTSATYLNGAFAWSTPSVTGGSLINIQYLTASSGTYTKTTGTNKIFVYAISGGGGGGSVSGGGFNITCGGGGGGGCAVKFYSTAPGTAAYTVGAGGGASANGGTTTFNSELSVTGGSAGPTSSAVISRGGTGGVASGGNINMPGQPGGNGAIVDTDNCLYGGNGGSAAGIGSGGGLGAVGTTASPVAGSAATGYGGGGGGACSYRVSGGFNGGPGAQGIIIVYEYA